MLEPVVADNDGGFCDGDDVVHIGFGAALLGVLDGASADGVGVACVGATEGKLCNHDRQVCAGSVFLKGGNEGGELVVVDGEDIHFAYHFLDYGVDPFVGPSKAAAEDEVVGVGFSDGGVADLEVALGDQTEEGFVVGLEGCACDG